MELFCQGKMNLHFVVLRQKCVLVFIGSFSPFGGGGGKVSHSFPFFWRVVYA